ncbi:MAG: biotin--[acetyl-CoA-carboxylase] ligase, partial [Proteobacteria bacterium]|nr:biotin--[acetyl-CoA-carboxylase] ligase [Pseudomonadota bacterium]
MEQFYEEGRIAGHPLRYLAETDSTNRVGLEQGQKGVDDGMVIVAGQQTAGRGRLGKKWLSSPGNGLYFSMILRPKLPLDELAKITLAAGVAVAEALQPLCRERIMLKWPNDIVIGGRKCGGILAEADLSKADRPLVVLGIGLNLSKPLEGYPQEIAELAGALADQSAESLDPGRLLEALVSHIDGVLAELELQDWPAIRRRWQQRDITKAKRLTWLTAKGEVISGVSQGIDEHGLLFIRDDSG